MDLTNQQIKDTYGNVLTIGATAGSPQTGTLQNGEGLNITSATLTGGTVTTSNPLLDMTQTWNDAGVTFTSLKLNVTDTASATASLLLDLQVGGSSKFNVTKAGVVTLGGSATFAKQSASDYIEATTGWSVQVGGSSGAAMTGGQGFSVGPNCAYAFASSNAVSVLDIFLRRDAAGVLAQRNSTNAQTFNIYNTYTDGSNYERGFLKWNSNVLKIGTEALGTGTARRIVIGTLNSTSSVQAIYLGAYSATISDDYGITLSTNNSTRPVRVAGTSGLYVGSSSGVTTPAGGVLAEAYLNAPRLEVDQGFTVATLPTPTVGMIARVTDGDAALTFGNTVVNSGAGATPYLCWYNGSNWTVIGA